MKRSILIFICTIFIVIIISCNNSKDIIILTDSGVEVDDQWMILHLVKHPEINVKAIVSSHCGHSDLLEKPQARSSYLSIIELMRIADIPDAKVIEGSNTALVDENTIFESTADDIYNIAKKYSKKNRLIAVVSGPATDIASALNKYPILQEKIEILATAFESKEEGGAGFNVNNDMMAWQLLLKQNIPITISTGTTAKEYYQMSKINVSELLETESEINLYLKSEYNSWLENNEELVLNVSNEENKWPIWDEILASFLIGHCNVEIKKRPILLDNGYFNYYTDLDLYPIQWIMYSDSNLTWENFTKVVN